jgi:hypothetical protein
LLIYWSAVRRLCGGIQQPLPTARAAFTAVGQCTAHRRCQSAHQPGGQCPRRCHRLRVTPVGSRLATWTSQTPMRTPAGFAAAAVETRGSVDRPHSCPPHRRPSEYPVVATTRLRSCMVSCGGPSHSEHRPTASNAEPQQQKHEQQQVQVAQPQRTGAIKAIDPAGPVGVSESLDR